MSIYASNQLMVQSNAIIDVVHLCGFFSFVVGLHIHVAVIFIKILNIFIILRIESTYYIFFSYSRTPAVILIKRYPCLTNLICLKQLKHIKVFDYWTKFVYVLND